MAEHHQDPHDALAPNGGTVQMLIRLGYATSPRQPRRSSYGLTLISCATAANRTLEPGCCI